jgi:small subunit ribosomal protein S8
MVNKKTVVAPCSNLKIGIINVLKDEGYIRDYKKEDLDGKPFLTVYLKYVNGESVIHEIKRVSKCGRRHYEKSNEIKPVVGGLGISILTTSSGIITDRQAKKLGVGGEVVCSVW